MDFSVLIEHWSARGLRDPRRKRFTEDGFALTEQVTDFSGQEFGCTFMHAESSDQTHVFAAVAAAGWVRAYVNGTSINTDTLWPAQVDYRVRIPTRVFDITESVHSGDNTLRIRLGTGRAYPETGQPEPFVAVQIYLYNGDRIKTIEASGDHWHVLDGPLGRNGIYYGEEFDARCDPGRKSEAIPECTAIATDRLTEDTTVPIVFGEVLPPVVIRRVGSDKYVIDFGRNIAGTARLTLEDTPAGETILLQYAELLHPDGTLNTAPNRHAHATDRYISDGKALQIYTPSFTYHGFRYIEVSGLGRHPGHGTIQALQIHSDVKPIGDLQIGHPGISTVHANIVNGQLSNLVGIPTDCPQRDERQGWLGDAHLSAEEAIYNFDMHAFFRDFLNSIADAQREDGALPDVVPAYWNLYPADPAWGSAYAQIAWLLYWYYGDTMTLERHYNALLRYLEFLRALAPNGIITDIKKYGDWCPPGSIAPKRTPLEFTNTWYYWLDLSLAVRIAEVLTRNADADRLRTRAALIRDAINDRFLSIDSIKDQTMHALALVGDLSPASRRPLIIANLTDSIRNDTDHHVDTGILGTRYLLDILTAAGAHCDAERIATARSYPGWLYMVDEGATSLWERWEKLESGGMNSQNHIMLGSIDAWFYKQVAGIQCLAPGWRRIALTPHPGHEVTDCGATLNIELGSIVISWETDADRLIVRCHVPAGCEALFFPPKGFGPEIILNNESRTVETLVDPDALRAESGYLVFLESGAGVPLSPGWSLIEVCR